MSRNNKFICSGLMLSFVIYNYSYEVDDFVQKLAHFWGFYDNEHIIEKEKFDYYLQLPLKELSYVLTTDNVLKLLGIQTRFRYSECYQY